MKADPTVIQAKFDGICVKTGEQYWAGDNVTFIPGVGLAKIPGQGPGVVTPTVPVQDQVAKSLLVRVTADEKAMLLMVRAALNEGGTHGYHSVGGVVNIAATVLLHLAEGHPDVALERLQQYVDHMKRIA